MTPSNALKILESLKQATLEVQKLARMCNAEQKDARKHGVYMPLSGCPSYRELIAAQQRRQALRALHEV